MLNHILVESAIHRTVPLCFVLTFLSGRNHKLLRSVRLIRTAHNRLQTGRCLLHVQCIVHLDLLRMEHMGTLFRLLAGLE